ncbi:hypothetical protein KM176_05695 [Pseudooceanicola sp. CBS1P-1]|uniref:Uncharacterized protein n=1 Tax=Pseudooceanicola albus TaxID=2692189 RepID=A0A6L7FWV2_9RHOB|nr:MULTISPECIES: hypothetical protein [Pseudooceanicola]MBT9383346.1 hypothetical protein [Pseudooceanicola endophyticus]MXN16331.1 hypothetical protein [Pseudooceanicola albus]
MMLTFCASCGVGDPLQDAARRKAQAAPLQLPDLPSACREKIGSGVQLGDRLDVALRKTDHALVRQWARVDDCAAWFEKLQSSAAFGAQK